MTAPVEDLVEQLGWVAELTRRGATPRGSVVGSHLEGPFLSSHRCGAQNEAHMIAPDLGVLTATDPGRAGRAADGHARA